MPKKYDTKTILLIVFVVIVLILGAIYYGSSAEDFSGTGQEAPKTHDTSTATTTLTVVGEESGEEGGTSGT